MVNLNSSQHSDLPVRSYDWYFPPEGLGGLSQQNRPGSQQANPSPYGVASSQSYDPNLSGYDKPSSDPERYVSGSFGSGAQTPDSPVMSHSAAAGGFDSETSYEAAPANPWYLQNVEAGATEQLKELMAAPDNRWIPDFPDVGAWEAMAPQSLSKPYPKIPPTYIVQSRNGYKGARAFKSRMKYSPEYSDKLLQVDTPNFSPQMGSKGQA